MHLFKCIFMNDAIVWCFCLIHLYDTIVTLLVFESDSCLFQNFILKGSRPVFCCSLYWQFPVCGHEDCQFWCPTSGGLFFVWCKDILFKKPRLARRCGLRIVLFWLIALTLFAFPWIIAFIYSSGICRFVFHFLHLKYQENRSCHHVDIETM